MSTKQGEYREKKIEGLNCRFHLLPFSEGHFAYLYIKSTGKRGNLLWGFGSIKTKEELIEKIDKTTTLKELKKDYQY